MKHPTVQLIIRILFVVSIVMIGVFLLYQIIRFTYPFLIALMLSFLLNPVIRFLTERLRLPRPIAVLAGVIFLFGVIGLILIFFVRKIVKGLIYLSHVAPQKIEKGFVAMQQYYNKWISPLWDSGAKYLDELNLEGEVLSKNGIEIIGNELVSLLEVLGEKLTNALTSFISILPISLMVISFIILSVYFISKDLDKYIGLYREKAPLILRKKAWNILVHLKRKMFGFLKAQIIMAFLTFLIGYIGLTILRVEHALTIAFIMGVLDFLPYLGTSFILIPCAIYSFFTGNGFLSIGFIVLYAITFVMRQFVEPKIVSTNIKLNPLFLLISLFIGFKLFGALGFLIAPLTLIFIISLYEVGLLKELWKFITRVPVSR